MDFYQIMINNLNVYVLPPQIHMVEFKNDIFKEINRVHLAN